MPSESVSLSESQPVQPPDPVEQLYRELEDKIHEYRPKDDLTVLRKAFTFASKYHEGQARSSGEPYMVHPVMVAHILAGMRMDVVAMETGLLHDVVEDTSVTVDQVRKEFGEEVARCVDGVTKLTKLDFFNAEERQAESFRKMLLAMVEDIRVIMVKLADRIHNMRTLGYLSPERRERIARETIEIYAPIAHRLGMGKIRGELEDLAFQHLEPDAYEEIMGKIESQRHSNEEFLEEVRQTVEAELRREGIPARIDGRVKRPYSVFQKLRRQKITVDQVYDLMALRIITDSVKNCYAALGVIHNKWRPIPGRIKDFIAIPRPNLYQSLHTSVVGPHGQTFEVQIRTEEMHRIAEEGIAAHWKYKEGRKGPAADDQRIVWLRHLVEWQRDVQDPGEFMSTLKVDLYPEEAYTFTPRGKVIVLPRDATPIDFAYAIHSDVGATCVGAKVNGRIVPLRSSLRNGDIVEIMTQPGHQPSKDWLAFVKTTRARNKIKHVINASERAKAIEIGEKYLEKEARRLGVQIGKIGRAELENVAGEYGFSKMEDLYAALGYGKYSARQVLCKVAPDQVKDEPEGRAIAPPAPGPQTVPGRPADADAVIRVVGVDDLLVYRAKCCNPIKGEAIVGYVTRGKGVAVHSKMCPNVQNLMYDVERKIEVEWARAAADAFPVRIVVHTDDRPGMLNQLTSIFSDENTNIRSLEAKTEVDQAGGIVEMTVDVRDKKQLEKLVAAMRRISGVRDVERLFN
ncbi:MAG TPA: bifunctional (p)ppGpp synthetase/guanosine-3',5'-bis(diphosphate) 3'-pyrophosphohydrolase [Candidatus Limnocylindrales bacterium]|nr:bifunctional (p)ppGpp synthetase/guanosine-3',5'-bis(diphosphate) 3'-pyrophosphohydrolase [Candidatus Limnocylindrales bacterium]